MHQEIHQGMDYSKLHVITMVSNPRRYHSRYDLYHKFRKKLEIAGIRLWTVEVAFGERPFELTQSDDIYDLQLRTSSELWIKERALQLLVRKMSVVAPDWRYVAWLDADIEFPNWDGPHAWWKETVQMLQHHQIVQLFSTALDLGPKGQTLHTHYGFGYSYRTGRAFKSGYLNWHPGFAWAMRREAYDSLGGFVDWGILGSGDRHMACAWVNKVEESVNHKCSGPYWRKLFDYEENAERCIRRDIGFVEGTLLHHWHGKKVDRGYQDRWKILTKYQVSPDVDFKPDAQGLWQFNDRGDVRSIEIRDAIRNYMISRNEDSIDLI